MCWTEVVKISLKDADGDFVKLPRATRKRREEERY